MAHVTVSISDSFRSAIGILLQAFDYASDSQFDRWQFAIMLKELFSSGATISDVRWLVFRDFAEHGKETTVPGDVERSFRRLPRTCFESGTCLVLTPDGAVALRSALNQQSSSIETGTDAIPKVTTNGKSKRAGEITPTWDSERKELRVDALLIKQFKWPAVNQETILCAFEEEGWPPRIDDPLPPEPEQDSKRRLSDTIKYLNRKQVNNLLHFRGGGDGESVVWEYIEQHRSNGRPNIR